MKPKIQKILSIMIVIAFVISIVPFVATTDAQTTPKKTYAFISATPKPVGVGQETLLHLGISEATNGTYWQWKGLTVTVEKPDGTKMTLGPFNTDSTGGTGTVLVPTKLEPTNYKHTSQNRKWSQASQQLKEHTQQRQRLV
jgi:hypothetical protein